MKPNRYLISDYMGLIKFKMSFMLAFSSLFGFVLHLQKFSSHFILLFIGILLLSFGCAVLNNFQDRNRDKLYIRTKYRPLAQGRISGQIALLISIILICSGLILLHFIDQLYSQGWYQIILGILAVIFYNGLYTNLKNYPLTAIIVGAICGTLPVYMGWMFAGGGFSDLSIWMICFSWMLWQIPHSWLIILNETSEIQCFQNMSILRVFNQHQLIRIIWLWMFSFFIVISYIALISMKFNMLISAIFFLITGGIFIVFSAYLFLSTNYMRFKFLFHQINAYILFLILFTSINHF
ncbi:MAG: UbiA family prenyltransferase [Deltaproteobacteria bacterium]|nr:UbiA family prenyltransferase [Deltaproteobacteria bacterium]